MNPSERVWRLLDIDGKTVTADNASVDVLTFVLQHEGSAFTVTIGGPVGMTGAQFTDALRAALYYGLRAGNADPTAFAGLGVRIPDEGELTSPTKPN